THGSLPVLRWPSPADCLPPLLWRRGSVKRQELFGRALGIGLDLLGRERQLVAEQQPDLHVAEDQTEEGPERRFGIVELEHARIPARFQQRLQALAHGEAA